MRVIGVDLQRRRISLSRKLEAAPPPPMRQAGSGAPQRGSDRRDYGNFSAVRDLGDPINAQRTTQVQADTRRNGRRRQKARRRRWTTCWQNLIARNFRR